MTDKVTKPGPATPGVFTLTDAHKMAVATTGRASGPSQYLDACREALATGDAFGVTVMGDDDKKRNTDVRRIRTQLARAADQLNAASTIPDGKIVHVKSESRNTKDLGAFVAVTVTLDDKAPAAS